LTTTILGTLPEIVEPDLLIALETTTPINAGSVFGGFELLPGPVVHVSPHTGGLVLTAEAKPLKLGGALPPLSAFWLDHVALQNVTVFGPTTAVWSPNTNEPWSRNAKMIVFADAEDGR
jgi:hypothetical protein